MDVEEWGVFLWALIAPVISLLVLVGLLLFILLRRRKKRQAYEALLKETYGDRYVPDNPPKPKAKPKATSPDEQV